MGRKEAVGAACVIAVLVGTWQCVDYDMERRRERSRREEEKAIDTLRRIEQEDQERKQQRIDKCITQTDDPRFCWEKHDEQ